MYEAIAGYSKSNPVELYFTTVLIVFKGGTWGMKILKPPFSSTEMPFVMESLSYSSLNYSNEQFTVSSRF